MGWDSQFDPTWNAQTPMSTGQIVINRHFFFISRIMLINVPLFGFLLWQYVRKAKARFFVLRAPFSPQLIDCNPCAAASANLPLTVTYWSVPLGPCWCGLSPQRSVSLSKRYTTQPLKCQDVWVSWKTTRRPYGAGLHVRKKKKNEIVGLFFPRVILKAFKSMLHYCHRQWSVCAETQRQGE